MGRVYENGDCVSRRNWPQDMGALTSVSGGDMRDLIFVFMTGCRRHKDNPGLDRGDRHSWAVENNHQ